MKTFIFALLLSISTSALADPSQPWTNEDTYREVTFQVLNVIDWGQTRYVAKNPDRFYEAESGWAIGKYPTTGAVDQFMIHSAILHFAISYLLPTELRAAWQYISIGGKFNATTTNAQLGVKISF